MISQKTMYFVSFIMCFLISAHVGNSEFMDTKCDNTTVYNVTTPGGSLYLRKMVSLLSVLSSNASQPNGFYNYTVGGGSSGQPVYGLFLCRGDVTATECRACLVSATAEILRTCSNATRAVTWYDDCMLRYSDLPIFSQLQKSPGILVWEDKNYTDGALLNRTLGVVFDKITLAAAYSTVPGKKFGVAEANLTEFTMLFALGQCTPDLSDLDCEYCLRDAVMTLPKCCNNRPGGSILRPSCNIRYSTTPFYHSVAPPALPTLHPPPSLPAGGGTSTATISAIVSSIVTVFLTFAMAFLIVSV